ncbi:family 78 glycoside hydrolase catalytic domain [Microbacterium sp. KSW2-21]|uniref:alpha-L-rhamnosidase n=1 Tax=Microbacterium algihabitans TaxID=3075992 RepID=A0ABU3S069_9MICO|nr:family 78 glycoside hydrolase catalytic domain [Microbacterium sp. KSW2-21]MDU0328450.1 family 78 glycoside hydrolase catalytic domain [Microbacterium sp. KSW2-21]
MSASTARIDTVRIDRRTDGAYADSPLPRVSWTVVDAPGWWQASARIRLDGEDVAEIEGDESSFVDWPFAPVLPHSAHTLEVQATSTNGETTAWSEPVRFVATFLADGEWVAERIGLATPSVVAAPALLRAEFDAEEDVVAAHLSSTAEGVFQIELNGQDVDDSVLKPGWSSYQYRTVHDAVDVTALVVPGRNALGIRLAGGWWTEEYGFAGEGRRVYGEQPSVAAQLLLVRADGSTRVIATGSGWRATDEGPVVSSGIYAGEHYDARRRIGAWSTPGFDDSAWSPVSSTGIDRAPEAMLAEPVRRTGEVAVKRVLTSPSGNTILDFGQNLVGRLRITVSGDAGHAVTLRHAEVLEDGELGLRPLRFAAATDRYVLAGDAVETWEPEFTFHGFRYAQIDDWPGEFEPASVTAIVIGSDMRRTGWFDSSNPLVNRLHENIVWGMRGNFLALPTDCPQRDERLGWTGDVQVFSPTASFLYDSDAFLSSWLRDVAAEQAAHDGVCPVVVPWVLPGDTYPAAAWGDAAVVVPSVLHERFGDRRALAEQYESMGAWADALLRVAGERMLWEGMFQFGDWLDPAAPPEHPEDVRADPDLVASAALIRALDLVTAAAATLGHHDDHDHYCALAERARDAFCAEYLTPAGRMMSDAPTAYAVALRYDIVRDPSTRETLGQRLAELLRREGYRMATGFVGTPLVQDALVDGGHADVAERLLLQTENPSWLYAVTMGATTVWERWDSLLEDGSVNPGDMTSFNHYAFGAVADWLHRRLAGLAPAAPGYRRLRIAPVLLPSFDHAGAVHDTPYGRAEVSWRRDGDDVLLEVTVPANTTAEIDVPGLPNEELGAGTHGWRIPGSVRRPAAPISPDSALSEVIDRAGAYDLLVEELNAHAPASAHRLRHRTRWVPQRTLRSELDGIPAEVLESIADRLSAL